MIEIYPGYRKRSSYYGQSSFFEVVKKFIDLEPVPFSSARAAMVYGLRALGIGRMDEILVPPWLGQCVLSALARTAFPTMIPSQRTKAILVFHQFGYPQCLEEIEKVASENGWIILNDCANTIFSKYRGVGVFEWGDFSVLSFSKLYPCTLGGALVSYRSEIQDAIEANYRVLSRKHAYRSNLALEILENAKRDLLGPEKDIEIDAVYGYIPELVAFPSNAIQLLPNTAKEIEKDVDHRKHIVDIVRSYFPDHVPHCSECEVVPFAVPIAGPPEKLELISREIKVEINVDVPILHFDFALNLLEPDYRPSLVIGCHSEWTEELVETVCDFISRELP